MPNGSEIMSATLARLPCSAMSAPTVIEKNWSEAVLTGPCAMPQKHQLLPDSCSPLSILPNEMMPSICFNIAHDVNQLSHDTISTPSAFHQPHNRSPHPQHWFWIKPTLADHKQSCNTNSFHLPNSFRTSFSPDPVVFQSVLNVFLTTSSFPRPLIWIKPQSLNVRSWAPDRITFAHTCKQIKRTKTNCK